MTSGTLEKLRSMSYQFQMSIFGKRLRCGIFLRTSLESNRTFIRNVAGDIKDIPKELQDRAISKPLPAS